MSKKWFNCPICGQKLLMIDDSKTVEGVYIKCKKCKQEVEVTNSPSPSPSEMKVAV